MRLGRHGRFLATMTVRGAGAVAQMAFVFLLTRSVDATLASGILLALSLIGFASVISRQGLDGPFARRAAQASAGSGQGRSLDAYARYVAAILFVGMLSSIVLFALGRFEPRFAVAGLLGAAVPALAVTRFTAEAMKGLGRGPLSQILETLALPASMVVALLSGLASEGRFVAVYVGAAWGLALLAFLLFLHVAPRPRETAEARVPLDLRSESNPLWLSSTSRFAIQWTGVFALGIWGTPEEISGFAISTRIALTSAILLGSASAIASRRFALWSEAADYARAVAALRRIGFGLAIAGLCLLGPIAFAPARVLGLFDPALAGQGAVLTILIFGQLVNLGAGPVGQLLVMTGDARRVRDITVTTALVNLVACLLLAPGFGAMGVAASTAAAVAFENLLGYVQVRRRLRVSCRLAACPVPSRA